MREHIHFLEELKNQYNLNVSEQVKNCKKISKNEICQAKIKSNDNLILSSKNPSKCAWNIINAQRGKQKIKTQNSGITADNFNEYFASIASNLVSGIPVSDTL